MADLVIEADLLKDDIVRLLIVMLFVLSGISPGIAGPAAGTSSEKPATSLEIINCTVVIDPGHGGADPGTIGYRGTLEKDVALAVSSRLASFLEQAGVKVVMTRGKDQEPDDSGKESLSLTKTQDLARRVAIANQSKADLVLSIHLNHFFDRTEYGAQAFYQHGSLTGKRLAQCIQTQLNGLLVDSGRQALAGDFFVCRNSQMPAVIVEVGFLSHPEEELALNDPAYQTRAAWAIYSGLVNYFYEQEELEHVF